MTLDFSIAAVEVRRHWKNAFNIPRENYFQPKFLFPDTLSNKYKGKIKMFQTCKIQKKNLRLMFPSLGSHWRMLYHDEGITQKEEGLQSSKGEGQREFPPCWWREVPGQELWGRPRNQPSRLEQSVEDSRKNFSRKFWSSIDLRRKKMCIKNHLQSCWKYGKT